MVSSGNIDVEPDGVKTRRNTAYMVHGERPGFYGQPMWEVDRESNPGELRTVRCRRGVGVRLKHDASCEIEFEESETHGAEDWLKAGAFHDRVVEEGESREFGEVQPHEQS